MLVNGKRRWGPLRAGDMNGVDTRSTIRLLIDSNPKRGKPRQRFNLYRSGMTVADFVAAVQGIGQPEQKALDDLCWDLNEGFIALDSPASEKSWSVVEAKAKLSEILRLVREGAPQIIGSDEPCVVVTAAEFRKYWRPEALGRFLIESAPRGLDAQLPPRTDDRAAPFDDEGTA